ncbi:MAG: hypothetical protein IJA91_00325 [Clostridia bacterium]|nr:hypothetical protein [Clostridia bacterium]
MKKILCNTILLLAVACMLMSTVTMSGCMVSVKAAEISADYTRTATEEGQITNTFVAVMADFAMTLTNTTIAVEKENKANHLISPLSAMICLSCWPTVPRARP